MIAYFVLRKDCSTQQIRKKKIPSVVWTGLKLAVMTYRAINTSPMMQHLTTPKLIESRTHGILLCFGSQNTTFNIPEGLNEISIYQYCGW